MFIVPPYIYTYIHVCVCYHERCIWLLPMDICSCGLSLADGEPLLILTYALARACTCTDACVLALARAGACVGAHSSSRVSRRCRRTLEIFGNEPRPRMRPQCVVITSINPMFSRGQLVPGVAARVVPSSEPATSVSLSRRWKSVEWTRVAGAQSRDFSQLEITGRELEKDPVKHGRLIDWYFFFLKGTGKLSVAFWNSRFQDRFQCKLALQTRLRHTSLWAIRYLYIRVDIFAIISARICILWTFKY